MNNIKFLIMDVDGTLTDGKIYMGNDGEVMKAFSIKDGYGIHDQLLPSGITPVVLTGRQSRIVENRCRELGIREIHQGVSNKTEKLLSLTGELACVAYIGDDLNDLPCMTAVKHAGGLIGCPADAVNTVRELSDFVSSRNGGEGAVREFIEWILNGGSN